MHIMIENRKWKIENIQNFYFFFIFIKGKINFDKEEKHEFSSSFESRTFSYFFNEKKA